VVGHGDAVAFPKRVDAVTEGGDFSDELVAEHRPRRGGTVIELEEIRPAQADDPHLEQQLAALGGLERSFFHGGPVSAEAGDDQVILWDGHDSIATGAFGQLAAMVGADAGEGQCAAAAGPRPGDTTVQC
jgi:hypothetical protein